MQRRTFMKGLLTTFSASVLSSFIKDPELALWIPGAKTIFIPPTKEIVQVQTGIMVATEEELSELARWFLNDGAGSSMRFSLATMSQEEWNMAIQGIRKQLTEEKDYAQYRTNRIITDRGNRNPHPWAQETSTDRA